MRWLCLLAATAARCRQHPGGEVDFLKAKDAPAIGLKIAFIVLQLHADQVDLSRPDVFHRVRG
jgi:hypothetical protein